MIRRRYPLGLALGGVALLLLAWLISGEIVALNFDSWNVDYGTTGPDEEEMRQIDEMNALIFAYTELVPWLVLAALIAGIAALVLLVLRARDQTGSASATASRDAAEASARS